MSKYLLFLTRLGGWSGKGQKHPYVRQRVKFLRRVTAITNQVHMVVFLNKTLLLNATKQLLMQ
jgi:hypothetical protein